jgi:hypothetical protein
MLTNILTTKDQGTRSQATVKGLIIPRRLAAQRFGLDISTFAEMVTLAVPDRLWNVPLRPFPVFVVSFIV